jgi:hypothetical protein
MSQVLSRILLVMVYLYSFFLRLFRKEKKYTLYPELQTLIKNLNSLNPPDILYFGDSVLLRTSKTDVDNSTLDQMFARKINSGYHVVSLAHTAYHMLIYLELVRVFYKTFHNPKIVVLPINMRSFSPQWDYHPSWQFWDEIKATRNYWVKLKNSSIFEDKKDVPNKFIFWLYDAMPVYYPEIGLKTVGYFRNIIKSKSQDEYHRAFRLKNIFCFHYMHQLVDAHPKIKAFIGILKILNGMGIYVVAYVTPVNWQAGEKYLEGKFVNRVKSNVNLIKAQVDSACQASLIKFSDLSLLLNSDCFFNEDDPTEHLNEKGRDILADYLKDLIPNTIKPHGVYTHVHTH